MAEYLSPEEAAQIIESAFAPLRCVAEPWDYDHRVKFRVFDAHDQPLLTVEDLVKSQFSNHAKLREAILAARENLAQRGVGLDQWAL